MSALPGGKNINVLTEVHRAIIPSRRLPTSFPKPCLIASLWAQALPAAHPPII